MILKYEKMQEFINSPDRKQKIENFLQQYDKKYSNAIIDFDCLEYCLNHIKTIDTLDLEQLLYKEAHDTLKDFKYSYDEINDLCIALKNQSKIEPKNYSNDWAENYKLFFEYKNQKFTWDLLVGQGSITFLIDYDINHDDWNESEKIVLKRV